MGEILEFRNVGKSFSGNHVLKDVSFKLKEGEILGLVGENGAGKSTMMNILFGMSFIRETGGYEGDVLIDGEKVNFKNPIDALEAGIGMVHQEFSLIPEFTATENILLNREITKKNPISAVFGKQLDTLERSTMEEKAKEAIEKLGVDINTKTLAKDMPVGHKQFLEIARELSKDKVKIIIMDEPTAVLTESEADILIDAMKRLAKRGIAIIFISHRLREIIDVCDQVIVLRDGEIIKDTENKDLNIMEIASWMVNDRFTKKVGPFKFRDDKAMKEAALKYIDELEIRTQGPSEKAKNLSGGNQQKVCLAKAFALEPKFLFVSEPTRGIDIGAKSLVLEALRKYNREHETSIVIISSELEELRSIADRILVIFEGKVFGELLPTDPVEYFGLMMAGTKPEEV